LKRRRCANSAIPHARESSRRFWKRCSTIRKVPQTSVCG
jgi:hypothetical protein